MLIKKYHSGHMKNKELEVNILKSIDSSPELRIKKELIQNFISSITPNSNIDKDWKLYVNQKKIEELEKNH